MDSPREVAERVLSGLPASELPSPAEIRYPRLQPDKAYVVVEMKLCEHCPRNFTRERGTDERLCPRCRTLELPRGETIADMRGGRVGLRYGPRSERQP